jgi:signal transduction histidine kinase
MREIPRIEQLEASASSICPSGLFSPLGLIAMTEETKSHSIPAEAAQRLRQLSHDLSNALEVILQTSYLLGTVELSENARQWRQMLDQGVQQATSLNSELRDYVRANSENAAA